MRTTTDFGTVKVVMLKGEKGDAGQDGKNGTFDNLTDAQKEEIKGDLAAFYRKDEGYYITSSDFTTRIPIPVSHAESDMLFVDIEGLSLMEGRDYTVDGDNIILISPITTENTAVHFTAMQAMAGKVEDYERIISEITEAMRPQIVDEILSNVYVRKLEGSYTTLGSTESITIPVEYEDGDALTVSINGLVLTDSEYTVSSGAVVLATPIESSGAIVHFVVERVAVNA